MLLDHHPLQECRNVTLSTWALYNLNNPQTRVSIVLYWKDKALLKYIPEVSPSILDLRYLTYGMKSTIG